MGNSSTQHQQFCELAKAVISTEAKAVADLGGRIDENFAQACDILLKTQGRIVVTGMGKSGHIGSKIAATLASTGSPAFFVHPGEASHGDLGMITAQDTVIGISYSGESEEILRILPLLKRLKVPLISLTGNVKSALALAADVHLDVSVHAEACPLGLAPTSSTTATLVMGDALAVALLDAQGFTKEDFAFSHPGGSLGKRLLLHVDDLMRTGEKIPRCLPQTPLRDMLLEMSLKGLGMTTILNAQGALMGIFTDGDLRRTLDQGENIQTIKAQDVMRTHYHSIQGGKLAAEALRMMEDNKVTCLVVFDKEQQLAGLIHMHDVLQAGLK